MNIYRIQSTAKQSEADSYRPGMILTKSDIVIAETLEGSIAKLRAHYGAQGKQLMEVYAINHLGKVTVL